MSDNQTTDSTRDLLGKMPEGTTVLEFAEAATEAEWLDARPEVRAAIPAWADEVTAEADNVAPEEHVVLSFERTCGAVNVGAAATWAGGRVTQSDPGVYVYFQENEARVTAADLRRYAADFAAVADALDAEPETIRRAHGTDEQLRNLDN